MSRISIIGAGHVGTTLGILFARLGHEIIDVVCRSLPAANRACAAIGGGRPLDALATLARADIYIIATSDNALVTIAAALPADASLFKDAIVFHCSGATPSAVLGDLRLQGAAVASVHPVKTFTDTIRDADSFQGTWCGLEGDANAVAILDSLFQTFGAKTFSIDGARKTIYHAGIVFINNYLFPLIEIGQQCYEAAGVPRAMSAQIVAPILHATVDNALRLGPAQALTGPIARGDDAVVRRQLSALDDLNPAFADLYKKLGIVAAGLAETKGVASARGLTAIRALLSETVIQ